MKKQKIIFSGVLVVFIFGLVCAYLYFNSNKNEQTSVSTKISNATTNIDEINPLYSNTNGTSTHIKPLYYPIEVKGYGPKEFYWPDFYNISDTKVIEKLRKEFDFKNNVKNDWKTSFKEIGSGESGYLFSNYSIHYDKNNILSFSISTEYSAAGLNDSSDYYNINLTNGSHITLKDFIIPAKIPSFIAMLNKKLAENISFAIEKNKQDNECRGVVEDTVVRNKEYNKDYGKFSDSKDNDFAISERGIYFIYNFMFSFEELCAPSNHILVSNDELSPYLDPNGLFKK